MTSTAHNCGGARRLSGAAAAAEAEEAATAVARLARARTGSWAGADAGRHLIHDCGSRVLHPPQRRDKEACCRNEANLGTLAAKRSAADERVRHGNGHHRKDARGLCVTDHLAKRAKSRSN